MAVSKPLPRCPVEVTLTLIDDRWKVLIIRELLYGTRRFGELRKSLGNISTKVLTSNLRSMEDDSLLTRQVYPEVPPKVEYTLTDLGYSLKPILLSMVEWGTQYKSKVEGQLPIRLSNGSIILIMKATQNDIPEIFSLQEAISSETSNSLGMPFIRIEELEREHGKGLFLKAIDETNKIVGAICGAFKKNTLVIFQILVAQTVQHNGIGEKMLCEIERLCPCKYYQIKTNTKNETVYNFLKKCGYIETKQQENIAVFQKNKI